VHDSTTNNHDIDSNHDVDSTHNLMLKARVEVMIFVMAQLYGVGILPHSTTIC